MITSSLRLRRAVAIRSAPFWKNEVMSRAQYSSSTAKLHSHQKENNEPPNNATSAVMSKLPFKSREVIVGGSIILAMGVSKALYSVTSSFLALTPAGSLYYGFIGGMVTMGMAAGFSYIGERSFRLNPNNAIRAAMQIVSKHKDFQDILGNFTVGPIKTYKSVASSIGVVSGKPGWISPRIEVVFQLNGKKSNAVVFVVYTKKGLFQEKCEFVELEIGDDEKAQKYFLTGDSEQFTIRSDLKRHASTLLKALKRGDH